MVTVSLSCRTGPAVRAPATEHAAGASLLELVVAISLTAVLAATVGGLLVTQLRVVARVAEQVRTAETVRIAIGVLQGELRRVAPGDVRAVSADSLALRAFRGYGIPCARVGGSLHVRYRGDRLPDADKDSALLVTAAGAGALRLLAAGTAAHEQCAAGAGERVLQLQFADVPDDIALVLIYESGSYHIASRALRYRLGGAGRQPLTAELLLSGSGFQTADPDVRLRLVTVRGVLDVAAPFGMGGVP
jgi:hypothetical protein